MSRRLSYVFILFAFTLFSFSCDTTNSSDSNQEETRFEDGIPAEVMDLLGEEMLEVIENDLKMPIHRGDNPPDIVAILSTTSQEKALVSAGRTIIMSPLILLETNVPRDVGSIEPGHEFIDEYFRFSGPDIDNYQIIVERRSVSPSDGKIYGTSSPTDFLVSGDENRFTVYGQNESVYDGKAGKSLAMRIFSGVFTEEGSISSPHYSIFMIDDGGVSDIIPSGTGRSFVDKDGIAAGTTWPEE